MPTTIEKALKVLRDPRGLLNQPEADEIADLLDGLGAEVEVLTAERDALRAELDGIKKQAPAALLDGNKECVYFQSDVMFHYWIGRNCTPLYLAAGAQPTEELAALRADSERFKQALEKINVIRDNIIATQSIGWSRHIYPLVAALDEVGVGCEIDAARTAS